MSIMRRIAVPLVGAVLTLSFTGCSNGIDGEYVMRESSVLNVLTVKGNNVTYEEIYCDGDKDESDADNGTLNNDQTMIVWSGSGRWNNTEPVVITENSITVDDETFYARNSDQGKAEIARTQERCDNRSSNGSPSGN